MILRCDECLALTDVDALDAKPELTLRLRLIRLLRGQPFMLRYAGDRNYDFTRLECPKCYGEGYVPGP